MDELKAGNRIVYENWYFTKNISDESLDYLVLRRFGGTKKIFRNVNFAYVIFEDCYFSECTFEDCNFTGAIFRNSNFRKSWFPGSDFSYALFENSIFEKSIFDAAPDRVNVRTKFARRLRLNFRNIGRRDLENRATQMQLLSTKVTLFKGWFSSAKYYRDKYKGTDRAIKFFQWIRHILLSFLWGNGESFLKLLRTTIIALVITYVVTVTTMENSSIFNLELILKSPAIFMGGYSEIMTGWAIGSIAFMRLTLMGLLLSMLVKKWAIR